jgi:hypothetical protein
MPANETLHTNWLIYAAGLVSGAVALVTVLWGSLFLYQQFDVKPASATPVLSPYSSAWLSGGHNPTEICSPVLEAYKREYPDFEITVHTSENSRKDWLGHVTYNYNCEFVAKRK